MTSADQLEQTYRRIYRRLTIGMFVAYAIVFGVAVTVLASGSATSWWPGGARSAPPAAALPPAGSRVEAALNK
ncbi:hypothetical protein BH11PSE4_BH11PSE4_31360 [soil metagenome]